MSPDGRKSPTNRNRHEFAKKSQSTMSTPEWRHLLASRLMRADRPSRAARFLVAIVAVVAAGMATGVGGADRAANLRSRAAQLRSETTALAAESHVAVVELYALDSELMSARARAASLAGQQAATRQEQADVQYRSRLARRTMRAAQLGLQRRLLALYESGDI